MKLLNKNTNTNKNTFNSNVCLRLAKSGLTYLSFSLKTTSNINLALGSLKNNKLMFNNINFKSFIHSSSILNSDSPDPLPDLTDPSSNPQLNLADPSSNSQPDFADPSSDNHTISPILEAVERLERERLDNLRLVKYQETPADDEEDP
jgi:hypothetical protein